MKKLSLCLFCFFMVLSLSACGKTMEKKTKNSANQVFDYHLEHVVSFAEKDGNIWTICEDSEEAVCYDRKGKKVDSIELGEGEHSNLILYKNSLFAFTFTEEGPKLTEYDFQTKKRSVSSLPEKITGAASMAVTDDAVYLIYFKEDYEAREENFEDYSYMGEYAVMIDRASYEEQKLDIDHAIAFYQISDTKLMYYAHDNKGYYFTIYDTLKHAFGKKNYNNLPKYVFSFAADEAEKNIFYTDSSDRRLVTVPVKETGQKTEFVNRIMAGSGNAIQYEKGNVYILDNITESMMRVNVSENLEKNRELTMYRTMSMEDPYGCGYTIHTEMLDEDEFALSVMAGDRDYDLCMIETKESKSGEIRDKGAFYPLNDIPGVKEYLDSCHAYIRETALDQNGDIWMLPIAVNIPFLLYNENACTENGIRMSDLKDVRRLLEIADRLYSNPDLRTWYSLNGYQMQQYMLNQYNADLIKNEEISYAAPEFQTVCELMKEHPADTDESLHTWLEPSSQYDETGQYYEKLIFALSHYYDLGSYDAEAYEKLRALPLPELSEKKNRYYGTCTCLSVNPNSENLEEALNFISAFCRYMLDREDTYLFKDRKKLPFSGSALSADIYEIYKKGDITFELPEEIFWNTYQMYQDNKIVFSEMAKELKRKVEMYVHE